MGKQAEAGQRAQSFSYEMNEPEDLTENMATIVDNTVICK